MQVVKTRIRLRLYLGWSESSHGAQSLGCFFHVATHFKICYALLGQCIDFERKMSRYEILVLIA